ncbi:MAG: GDP-mannose 4,6-dehydratase, partial [Bacteroidia bacterium]
LCDQLLSNGHKVVAVDNLINGKLRNIEQAQRNPDFSFIQEDILNASKMIELTKGVDVIFHLACLGVRHSIHSPRENHLVNAEGSLNMLEAARANHVKHFYYISTSEIYGDVKTFPINEFAVPLPKTVYGSSKLAGENYAYSYFQCYQLPVTVLRIFNNYGPRAHYEGDAGEVIPRSIVNMLYGKNPIIFGDGSVTRDFFFVKDTAKVLSELINIKGLAGEIINIGTGEEITMKHLMEQLITLVNNGNHIEYLDDRPADVPRLWVDNAKFKTITGFKSAVSFEQGLTETINYYKDLKKNHDLISEIKTLNWTK